MEDYCLVIINSKAAEQSLVRTSQTVKPRASYRSLKDSTAKNLVVVIQFQLHIRGLLCSDTTWNYDQQ